MTERLEARRKHLHELIDGFDQGMLVTRSLGGPLHARPMALSRHDRRERLYFVTDEDSAKTDEIRQHAEVNVTFQDDGRYVSISGAAKVLHDPALAHEIWSPTMRAWFPDGPGDPSLRIVEVEARRAEYWDVSGPRRLAFFWLSGAVCCAVRRAALVRAPTA